MKITLCILQDRCKVLNKILANQNQMYAKNIIYMTKLGIFRECTSKIRQKLKSRIPASTGKDTAQRQQV